MMRILDVSDGDGGITNSVVDHGVYRYGYRVFGQYLQPIQNLFDARSFLINWTDKF